MAAHDGYYADYVRLIPLGSGASAAIPADPDAGAIVRLDPYSARVLELCHGCRTLEQHAAAIRAVDQRLDARQLEAALSGLCHTRLLRRPILASPSLRAARDISIIGITTADRPELLSRCLDSFIAHCARHDRRVRFLIVDGSRSPQSRAANQRTCATRTTHEHPVGYVGRSEIAALAGQLADAGSDARAARFAVSGGTTGANRNVLLLLTAGANFLMCDDDIVCRTWAPAGRQRVLEIAGHADATGIAFFLTRKETLDAAEFVDEDLLLAHQRLLGASLPELCASAGSDLDLTEACPHLLSALASTSRPHVVRLTMAGLAGDAGVFCPYLRLFGRGAGSQSLLGSEAICRTGLTSREVLRCASRASIGHTSNCQAYCMGIANASATAVPFLPVGRNGDGVFAAMLMLCDRYTLLADVPLGIVHDSDRPAAYDSAIRSATDTRIAELLHATVAMAAGSVRTDDETARARLVGEALIECGRLEPGEFRALVTAALLEPRAARIRQAEAAERHFHDGRGAAYAAYRQQLRATLADDGFVVPIEFRDHGSIEEALGAVRQYLRDCGSLLTHWQQMVAAAAECASATGGAAS